MDAITAQPGALVVLRGRLEAAGCTVAREVLHTALESGRHDLIVDISGLERIDLAGLGVLLGVHRRADRLGRRMVLRAVPPRMGRILARTRFERIFAIESAIPATAA